MFISIQVSFDNHNTNTGIPRFVLLTDNIRRAR